MDVQSAYLCRSNSHPLLPPPVIWIHTEKEGVQIGPSSVHKPGKHALSCKANKYNDAGAADLDVLTTPKKHVIRSFGQKTGTNESQCYLYITKYIDGNRDKICVFTIKL